MLEPIKALLLKLSHPDERVFENGLVELAFTPIFVEDAVALFTTACEAISNCDGLGPIERQRRVGLILDVAPKSSDFQTELAQAAQTWQPPVKNAVARFLQPEHRSKVYGRIRQTLPQFEGTPDSSTIKNHLADKTTEKNYKPEVLLLGTESEHLTNARLLDEHGFRPLRAKSQSQYGDLIRNNVCGIVVGNSWWAIVPTEQHHKFVEQLFGYSSLAWIKIDYRSCACRATIHDIAKDLRCKDVAAHEVVSTEISEINADVDIRALRRAAQKIQNEPAIQLCPADIPSNQAKVLIAGILDLVESRNPRGTVCIEEIATSTINGGLSSALVVRAQPNVGGAPFIAKLDSMELLRNEMLRFDSFIRPWDNQLRPCLHYHNGTGIIVFGLVGTPDNSTIQAPTLEATLHDALLVETGGSATDQPTESDLFKLMNRTVERIRTLNARPCLSNGITSMAWIDASPLKQLGNRDISWHFSASSFDLLARCNDAETLLNEIRTIATVHGDIHLRNVLVRDREPHLIDYAYSGPGHPCYDLVRLEAAVLFQVFRMTHSEDAISDLLRSMSESSATMESLKSRHPMLCTSVGNRLAIHTSLLCRQACLELLAGYRAPPKHLAAMQFIIACQALADQRFQTGIARAAVCVAGEAFVEGT